ncbi:acetylxylan esterase [Coprobacter sp.]
MKKRVSFVIVLFSCVTLLSAQVSINKTYVNIRMVPNHADWVYKPGENPELSISVEKSTEAIPNVTVSYELGPEMLSPDKTGTLTLKNGTGVLKMGTMKKPGFRTCKATVSVDGVNYTNWVTVGFSPDEIKPTVPYPADFMTFWNDQKSKSGRLPLDVNMVLLPEKCTSAVNVYQISYNYASHGARFYGILCIPKAEGKYPAILHVPGAGVRSYGGAIEDAERGFITLQVGIHGIPVNLSGQVYNNLRSGILRDYNIINLDNKEAYYYNKVYMGCKRGVDVICSLPQFDGEHLATYGGSQGGALSIVVASLDSRVKCAIAFYPALSDMTGYLHGRTGGWPHMLKDSENSIHNTPEKLETIGYYDVVNFARNLKVPVFFSCGFNDRVCPPTSTFSVYNSITSPKELMVVPETAHWAYPDQRVRAFDFILKQFNMK